MRQITTRESEESAKKIIDILMEDGEVAVHNDYETFYGVGFDGWLRGKLKDIKCEIKVTSMNHWEGYPWSYEIRLLKEGETLAPEPKTKKVKVFRLRTIVTDRKTLEWVTSWTDIELTDNEAKVLGDIMAKIELSTQNKKHYEGFGSNTQEDLSYMHTPLVQKVGNGKDKCNRFYIEHNSFVTEEEYPVED